MTSSYDYFAEVYDRWMGDDFARRFMPVLERLFLSELPSGAHILDVCCGTGKIARMLSELGYHVTGIDASAAMLRLAANNAPACNFLHADARGFSLERTFNGAISTFNSLSHFEDADDLVRVFTRVQAVLVPHAPFLFDIAMEEAFRAKWRGAFSVVSDDHACIVQPSYDADTRTGKNSISLFRRNASECWSRNDLVITQKCHSLAEVADALSQAGFTSVEHFDLQRDLDIPRESGRMVFLCH